jgi:hypothetical protein
MAWPPFHLPKNQLQGAYAELIGIGPESMQNLNFIQQKL